MLVLVQVSSTKTRRLTSSTGFSVFQRSRAAAISGRVWSAATRDFFERQLEPARRFPYGGDADRDAQLLQDPDAQLIQRHVREQPHLRSDDRLVPRELRSRMRPLRPRRYRTKPIPALPCLHHIGDAYPEPGSNLA